MALCYMFGDCCCRILHDFHDLHGFYRNVSVQERLLRGMLPRKLHSYSTFSKSIAISTVDAFQGREADAVVFSCVRAQRSSNWHEPRGGASGIGFLADIRRMNVGLTRARRSLWVVGHAATLHKSAPWRALLQHAKREGVFYQALRPYSELLSSKSLLAAELPK
jgi:superfamily I DNA and/or RNA helicase